MRAVISSLVFSCIFAACGGAADSPLLQGDAGSTGNDGSNNGDGNGSCDITQCVTVPAGFAPVALMTEACPGGWTSTDVVSAPQAGDGTCTCACDVTAPPSCDMGPINRFYDQASAASCGTTATMLTANGTPCEQLTNPIQLVGYHYKVQPVAPSGGACQYNAALDSTKITSTAGHVCAPPASCAGALCGGDVCVQQAGDVTCPSGFPQKTLVGTDATASCGTCGATCVAAGKCSGTLTLFSDQNCMTGAAGFTADGTCTASTGVLDGLYYSFNYTGMLSGSGCEGTAPPSTPTVALDGQMTVCCQH